MSNTYFIDKYFGKMIFSAMGNFPCIKPDEYLIEPHQDYTVVEYIQGKYGRVVLVVKKGYMY